MKIIKVEFDYTIRESKSLNPYLCSYCNEVFPEPRSRWFLDRWRVIRVFGISVERMNVSSWLLCSQSHAYIKMRDLKIGDYKIGDR